MTEMPFPEYALRAHTNGEYSIRPNGTPYGPPPIYFDTDTVEHADSGADPDFLYFNETDDYAFVFTGASEYGRTFVRYNLTTLRKNLAALKAVAAPSPPAAMLPPGTYYKAGKGNVTLTQSQVNAHLSNDCCWSYNPATDTMVDFWTYSKEAGWTNREPATIKRTPKSVHIFTVIPDPKEN